MPGPEAMGLNVTRELGIDATVRVLRNVVDRIGQRRPPGD
ncbi:unannotated protein [freshwater metagenome]|uniref:Unannotated protein n=1 Tax=freshwater metagenome TaxID=449393 RepID=A0A6J7CZU2_9ZZZZ